MMHSPLSRTPWTYIVAVFLACWTLPLSAQRISLSDAAGDPVYVESAEVTAEITGRIAVTRFDLVFRNPNGRVLEGALEFPLLNGQTVTGFALDIDGKLRDAVPVQKDKARLVFEDIER